MKVEVVVNVPDGRTCRGVRLDCDYLDRGVKNHYCSLFGKRVIIKDGYMQEIRKCQECMDAEVKNDD